MNRVFLGLLTRCLEKPGKKGPKWWRKVVIYHEEIKKQWRTGRSGRSASDSEYGPAVISELSTTAKETPMRRWFTGRSGLVLSCRAAANVEDQLPIGCGVAPFKARDGLDSFLWWLDSTLVRFALFSPLFLSPPSCSTTPHVGIP